MNNAFDRRAFLLALGALGAFPKQALALSASGEPHGTRVAAAWRGPAAGDSYFAGVLEADWQRRKLSIRYEVRMPTRPHGLVPEADGSLLVIGVRPGAWLMRCDEAGRVMRQVRLEDEGATRLNGHAAVAPGGEVIYTTETDQRSGRGRIGVRELHTLKKLDEWNSHGIDPHQLLLDPDGCLMVANGGVPRTPADKKYDLQHMESSLVRLNGGSGALLRQWRLDDHRLSLRHLAWSESSANGKPLLGVAMQAEHDDAAQRARAPILAVLEGDSLYVPTRANDGVGYAGDIAPAFNGGFALSSNQAGLAQVWHPRMPDRLMPIVELQEAYALTGWSGPQPGGGVLVATAPGLVRWHPSAKAAFLAWPRPMALDNHWVLVGEA